MGQKGNVRKSLYFKQQKRIVRVAFCQASTAILGCTALGTEVAGYPLASQFPCCSFYKKMKYFMPRANTQLCKWFARMQTTSLNRWRKRSLSCISIKVYTKIPVKDVNITQCALIIEHLFIQPVHRSLFWALRITQTTFCNCCCCFTHPHRWHFRRNKGDVAQF